MAYQKQTFIDNQTVIKAEHFNHIEDGIVAVETVAGNAATAANEAKTTATQAASKADSAETAAMQASSKADSAASAAADAQTTADAKQDKLVSGTNIKTVNGQSLLGDGDITIESGDFTVVGGSDGAQWAGKTWYAYGTSLTATNKYTKTVQELSGLSLVNKGISGGGISAGSKAVKAAIMKTTDGKLNADLITLEVGANDASTALGEIYDTSDSTFCGNLNQCIRYLQENTEAQIVVLSSTNAKRNTSSNTEATPEVKYGSDNHTKYDQWKATEEVAKINSVYYIPMGEGAGLGYARMNSKYLSDAIHHTDLGGKNLGSFVWSCLKNIPRWYASATDEEDTTVFYTITYNYVDVNGNQIKPPTEVKTTAGTEFTFNTNNAETIDGYNIKSVSPSGTVTITGDITVTFTYEPIASVVYYTVTYKYVDSNGNALKENTIQSVTEGTALDLTMNNAPVISGYNAISVSPTGSVTVTSDLTVTYTYEERVATEITDIKWYGRLAGGSDFQVFWEDNGTIGVITTDASNERSVGIVDVSAYQGRSIEMTYSQNYSSVKSGGYAAFLSGGELPLSATRDAFDPLAPYVIEKWNNCDKSSFVNVTTNVTTTKTIPANAKWLVFLHIQESISGGFNGSLKVM